MTPCPRSLRALGGRAKSRGPGGPWCKGVTPDGGPSGRKGLERPGAGWDGAGQRPEPTPSVRSLCCCFPAPWAQPARFPRLERGRRKPVLWSRHSSRPLSLGYCGGRTDQGRTRWARWGPAPLWGLEARAALWGWVTTRPQPSAGGAPGRRALVSPGVPAEKARARSGPVSPQMPLPSPRGRQCRPRSRATGARPRPCQSAGGGSAAPAHLPPTTRQRGGAASSQPVCGMADGRWLGVPRAGDRGRSGLQDPRF